MNEEIKIKDFLLPSLFKFLISKYFISVSLDNFILLKQKVCHTFFLMYLKTGLVSRLEIPLKITKWTQGYIDKI